MYQLTEYSEKHLRLLSGVTATEINVLVQFLETAKQYLPAGEVYDDITRRDAEKLEALREHHVHLLSALAMVKDKNLVASN